MNENNGKRWTKEEDDKLLANSSLMSLKELSSIHGRSVKAVQTRLRNLTKKEQEEPYDLYLYLIEEKTPLKEIGMIFNVQIKSTDELLYQYIKTHKYSNWVKQKLWDSLTKKEIEKECAVCMDEEIKTVFQCGHGTCSDCAQKLNRCPHCQEMITQKIKIFI